MLWQHTTKVADNNSSDVERSDAEEYTIAMPFMQEASLVAAWLPLKCKK